MMVLLCVWVAYCALGLLVVLVWLLGLIRLCLVWGEVGVCLHCVVLRILMLR